MYSPPPIISEIGNKPFSGKQPDCCEHVSEGGGLKSRTVKFMENSQERRGREKSEQRNWEKGVWTTELKEKENSKSDFGHARSFSSSL